MRVAVIDGQGGGIGKSITEKIKREFGENIEIIALGTNALAAFRMLKAGANEVASGENAICVTVKDVDIIMGPISIIVANSMLGELTPKMAQAICEARAQKVLMPLNKLGMHIVGLSNEPLPHLIDMMVTKVRELYGKRSV
ncbi:DUF3842 family protein [Desulfolucanica intricata]|uniref:DUF3842 family protein n=1 Tax=Desulfolucanica intricata TaxID=1285191 RepID=UPI0008335588|nr:DUF3842 family protein [Desulfolucanica intricata]